MENRPFAPHSLIGLGHCREVTPKVFDGPTYTYEDDRFDYSEQRFVTLGLLEGLMVSIVHTETPRQSRIIFFRKATKHDQAIFFKNF